MQTTQLLYVSSLESNLRVRWGGLASPHLVALLSDKLPVTTSRQCLCAQSDSSEPLIAPSPPSPPSPLMSHAHPTPASSPNFQLIFNNALKAYEKRTKSDLLAHPLVAQLQACDSPTAILALIHQQLQGLHQSQRGNERLTKWLNPTVNVLFTLSASLGEGVGLVSLWT